MSFMHLSALALVLSFVTSPAYSTEKAHANLSLGEFLNQVQSKNQGFQSAQLSQQGGDLRSGEASLITIPQFFATAQLASDARKQLLYDYEKILNNTYSLGITQQTPIGLQAKLSYTLGYMEYRNIIPTPGASGITRYGFEGRPVLELQQSFGKNFFGAEVRAQKRAIEAGALATEYAGLFKQKVILAEAEGAYWRLAFARENVALSQDALERAQKLYDWAERRSKLNLGDQSDFLQAQSALKLRKLQLQAAQDEERSAALAFNTARGETGYDVSATLDNLDSVDIPKTIERSELRADTRSAQEAQRATAASAEVSAQRYIPTIDVYGSYGLSGFETEQSDAISNSFKGDRPTYAVGIRVNMPLLWGAALDAKDGWRHEQVAAERAADRKWFEQEQDWVDLNQRLDEGRRRYDLAKQIEAVQQQKLNYERDRLNRGRTTTFQVLQFEQEYQQSRLTRMQVRVELLQTYARLKLFEKDKE